METRTLFTQAQLDELSQIAEDILIDNAWDALPWDDAWRGIYPEKPQAADIEKEREILKEKVLRIWSTGSIENENESLREHITMLRLEDAKTFNLQKTMKHHLFNRARTGEQPILDLLNRIEQLAEARRTAQCDSSQPTKPTSPT